MSGGNWSKTDLPVLPGMYFNFQAAAVDAISGGPNGVVVAPVKAHWGPIRQFVEVSRESDILSYFTNDSTGGATAYNTLHFALMPRPQKILAYRIASTLAAKSTIDIKDTGNAVVIRLTALYEGERGNDFNITIAANLLDGTKKDIKILEGTTLLCTITTATDTTQGVVDAINSNTSNRYVVATLTTAGVALANITTQFMTGGDSGIAGVSASDYTDALTAFESREFNVLTLDGSSDASIQTTVGVWVDRVRSEGKEIIAVMGGSGADDIATDAVAKAVVRSVARNHEGVVGVASGGVLNGVSYSSAQTAAWVAGAIAASPLNGSVTYLASPFEDVTRRWTRSEQETAVKNGVFVLFNDGNIVRILRGINSLNTLRVGQNKQWKKIRAIRSIDAINSGMQAAATASYIGIVNNTNEGRLALAGAGKLFLGTLAASGVIDTVGYDCFLDPQYYGPGAVFTPDPDQVFLTWTARIADSMEQIFGTFNVQ